MFILFKIEIIECSVLGVHSVHTSKCQTRNGAAYSIYIPILSLSLSVSIVLLLLFMPFLVWPLYAVYNLPLAYETYYILYYNTLCRSTNRRLHTAKHAANQNYFRMGTIKWNDEHEPTDSRMNIKSNNTVYIVR